MKRLPEPSSALSGRILSEVGFNDRFIGYRLRQRTGAAPVTLYSFGEVFGLLSDPHPRIDFDRLEEWIRDVMKDTALADKIKEVVKEDFSGSEKTLRIRDLMEERLFGAIRVYKKSLPA
jgi:hypothetical protein